nr:TSUP family transporter [Weissella confusa]
MLNVLYIVATFIATVIGALAGIGGGIVLKAMTDIFSPDSVQVISFYTTVVVFTICLVSIVKQIKSGFKYGLPMLLEISVGSLVGGYIGDSLLTVLLRYFPENKVQLTQSIILFLTLIFLIIYTRAMPQRKHVEKPHWLSSFGLGVFLGAISIFWPSVAVR